MLINDLTLCLISAAALLGLLWPKPCSSQAPLMVTGNDLGIIVDFIDDLAGQMLTEINYIGDFRQNEQVEVGTTSSSRHTHPGQPILHY